MKEMIEQIKKTKNLKYFYLQSKIKKHFIYELIMQAQKILKN